jgi:ribosomal protein S18 acetylase RimI-like enzyme
MTEPDGLRVVDVDATLADTFLRYARDFGGVHDDSYVTHEDLAVFDPTLEPAVLALDGGGVPLGAASVMLRGYENEGLGRFRILHAASALVYARLLETVLARVPAHVTRIFLFMPEFAGEAEAALERAGFAESRRAYVMLHSSPGSVTEPELPSETLLEEALPTSAVDWANIVNIAFRGEPGRYDMTAERAGELLARPRVIRGGTLVAHRGGRPAGIVMTVADDDDVYGAEIETLAVMPADQHVGLGRALMRAALRAAGQDGRSSVSLSVSTFNKRALAMYLDAGFSVHDVRVCWQLSRA